MHSLKLDNIDQEKYLRLEGWWNTRLIREHFLQMAGFLNAGWFDQTMKVGHLSAESFTLAFGFSGTNGNN